MILLSRHSLWMSPNRHLGPTCSSSTCAREELSLWTQVMPSGACHWHTRCSTEGTNHDVTGRCTSRWLFARMNRADSRSSELIIGFFCGWQGTCRRHSVRRRCRQISDSRTQRCLKCCSGLWMLPQLLGTLCLTASGGFAPADCSQGAFTFLLQQQLRPLICLLLSRPTDCCSASFISAARPFTAFPYCSQCQISLLGAILP